MALMMIHWKPPQKKKLAKLTVCACVCITSLLFKSWYVCFYQFSGIHWVTRKKQQHTIMPSIEELCKKCFSLSSEFYSVQTQNINKNIHIDPGTYQNDGRFSCSVKACEAISLTYRLGKTFKTTFTRKRNKKSRAHQLTR